jgi:acetylcholinesterase
MRNSGRHDDSLFNGAILESPFLPIHPPVSELEWQFDNYVHAAGCTDSIDHMEHMECLWSKDTETLQIANRASPYPGRGASPRFYWTPIIDGDFIQDYPYRMFEIGRFIKLPVVIGGTDLRRLFQ